MPVFEPAVKVALSDAATDDEEHPGAAASSSTSSGGDSPRSYMGSSDGTQLSSPGPPAGGGSATKSKSRTVFAHLATSSDSDSSDSDSDDGVPAFWWTYGQQSACQQGACQQEMWNGSYGNWNQQVYGGEASAKQAATPYYGELPALPASYSVAALRRKKISCTLSKVLRHTAHSWGIRIGADGFVAVQELLNTAPFWQMSTSFEDVLYVVRFEERETEKQRFSLRQGPWGPEIRATQGHSQGAVDGDLVSQPAGVEELPKHILHGTYLSKIHSIVREGLKPMTRHHVHFFVEETVVGRRDAEVLIHLDVAKACERGLEFLVSENGVVLTTGGDKGIVPPECFAKVVRLHDGAVLNVHGDFEAEGGREAEGWKRPKAGNPLSQIFARQEETAPLPKKEIRFPTRGSSKAWGNENAASGKWQGSTRKAAGRWQSGW